MNQSGSGRRPRVIAVSQSKPFTVKAVIPSEQTAAQAKSELEREGINPEDVVRAIQSDTGREKKRKRPSVVEIKRENNSKNRNTERSDKKVKTGKEKSFGDIFDKQ